MVTAASIKFSNRAFTTPLRRSKPASNIENPVCMKNTKKPVSSTQVVSMEICNCLVVASNDSSVTGSAAWTTVGAKIAKTIEPIASARRRYKGRIRLFIAVFPARKALIKLGFLSDVDGCKSVMSVQYGYQK
jgi:hypothetical protein